MAKRYAVLATLEWSARNDDGSLDTTRVEAGEVVDTVPAESVDDLLKSKAIEPYDAKVHRGGWFKARYDAELDKASVKAGGIPRREVPGGGAPDRGIAVGDTNGAAKDDLR